MILFLYNNIKKIVFNIFYHIIFKNIEKYFLNIILTI